MILFLSDLYLFFPFIFWVLMLSIELIFFLQLNLKMKKSFLFCIYTISTMQKLFLISMLISSLNIKFITLLFDNSMLFNDFVLQIDLIILITTCIYLIIMNNNFFKNSIFSIEIFFFLAISIFGLLLVLKSINLMVFFINFELQTFCLYCLALMKKHSLFSNESGLKYFLTGALISSVLMLGISVMYGFFGNMNLLELKIITENKNYFFNFYNLFFVMTLFYKLGLFPLGQWMPDVYEASLNIMTFFFSVIPKVIYIFLIMMFFNFWFKINFFSFTWILLIFGLFSIIQSSMYSLNQIKLKSLLTYSGMVQSSYVILGISFQNFNNIFSSLFFLSVYVISTFTMWTLITNLNFKQQSLYLTDFIGLNKINMLFSFSFLVIFLNYSGLPPFLGFFSKLFLLNQIMSNSAYFMAIIMVLTSALTIFYYLKLCYLMYFKNLNNFIYNVIFQNLHLKKVFLNFYLLGFFMFMLLLGLLNSNVIVAFICKMLLYLIN